MTRPIRTFLDSGVLIAAFNGPSHLREMALKTLEDPDRVFLTSRFVRLEVLPKAIFNRRSAEIHFYEKYFARAVTAREIWAILRFGEKEAANSGVGALDSLYLAAAHLLRAHEFITTEKPGKSIHRPSLVKVVYLFS
ncbi:MAG TPA: PIN domain-containing protein [Bryobacteraceae bacterium]|nr:PIN domain-containing protein [Bryobacteraceae bacterium]